MAIEIVKDTPEDLALAAKYEAMTDEEWDEFERKAEEDGRVVHNVSIKEGLRILDERKKRMVSMRVEQSVVEKLKAKAELVGIPYQTLAASVLKRYVEGNLDIVPA